MQPPLATAVETRSLPRIRTKRAGLTVSISPEARWLWAAVVVFVAVSFWWLTQDGRIPIWDAGNHM
ncbi:MAG: hypothetical protein ACRDPA_10500, partial [Solirubrobacteraceae bacterium]